MRSSHHAIPFSLMGANPQYGNQNCPVIEHRQPAIYASLPRSMKQREQRTCEWEIKKERAKHHWRCDPNRRFKSANGGATPQPMSKSI